MTGDTGRTERRVRDAISFAMAKWHPELLAGAVDDAARAVVAALAPEPSGVPPGFTKDYYQGYENGESSRQADYDGVIPEFAECWPDDMEVTPHNIVEVLNRLSRGATTEVERVVRAVLAEISSHNAARRWHNGIVPTAEGEAVVARVVARLGATSKEEA